MGGPAAHVILAPLYAAVAEDRDHGGDRAVAVFGNGDGAALQQRRLSAPRQRLVEATTARRERCFGVKSVTGKPELHEVPGHPCNSGAQHRPKVPPGNPPKSRPVFPQNQHNHISIFSG